MESPVHRLPVSPSGRSAGGHHSVGGHSTRAGGGRAGAVHASWIHLPVRGFVPRMGTLQHVSGPVRRQSPG